jgi:hypothetical protein
MTTVNNETLLREAYIYNPDTFYDKGQEAKDQGSILFQFIRSLRPGMDMASIMCPTFVIRPISFLEFLAIYTQPNQTLLNASYQPDPEKRIIDMTVWILATLTVTPQNGFAGIKPYNPVLGEQFHCSWEHDDSSVTELHSEQVSHHPPISALEFRNRKHGIHYVSTGEFKAKFRGNYVDSCVEGLHILHLESIGESYQIVWPTLVARGIMWGNARIEHGSNLSITCDKTGYKAVINFDYSDHKLLGHIFKGKERVIKIEGELTGTVHTKDERTKEKKIILDVSTQKREKYVVADITKQSENFSRRIWHPVTYALKTGDLDKAAKYKTEIEEHQRKLAKARKEKQETWIPKLFFDTNQRTDTGVPVYSFREGSTENISTIEEQVENLDLD